MQPCINMITLGVRDLARAVDFYGTGLGLPRLPFDADGIAFFALNGTWLALYPWDALAADATVSGAGEGFRGVTLAQQLPSREAVDALMAEAVRAGATLVKPAQMVFWGGYSGYFADPDNHLWEVSWNPHFWAGPRDDDAAGE